MSSVQHARQQLRRFNQPSVAASYRLAQSSITGQICRWSLLQVRDVGWGSQEDVPDDVVAPARAGRPKLV
eukprot:scaffold630_cov399-Prasinococcus_capsulatus_cf.AAC.35